MHNEVVHYISNARGYGLKDPEIRIHLLQAGWDRNEIDEAFAVVDDFNLKIHELGDHSFQPAIQIHTRVIEGEQTPSVRPVPGRRLHYLWFAAAGAGVLLIGLLYWVVFPGTTVFGYSFLGTLLERAGSANNHTLQINYSDPEKYASGSLGSDLGAVDLDSLKLIAVSRNFRDSNGSSEGETELTFENLGTAYGALFHYKQAGGKSYLKLEEKSGGKFASGYIQNFFGVDPTSGWVVFDSQAPQNQGTPNAFLTEQFNGLIKGGVLQPRFKGFNKLESGYAFHYSVSVNREKLLQAVLDQMPSNDSAPTQMVSNEQRQIVENIINKLEIGEIGFWFGIADFSLKKVALQTNAPSLASLTESFLQNYTQTLAKANDDRRLSDIKQIRRALELFYNDNKGYPEGVAGVAQNLSEKYLVTWPASAPPSGNCADYYNTYWYKHKGEPKTGPGGIKIYSSYTLTFCLGFDTAELKAGLGIATPSGITTTVACEDAVNPCFLPESRQVQNPESFSSLLNRIKFTGQLSVTYIPEKADASRLVAPPQDVTQTQ